MLHAIIGEEKNKLPESSTKWKRKLSAEPLNNKHHSYKRKEKNKKKQDQACAAKKTN